jgi:hypothetical protein
MYLTKKKQQNKMKSILKIYQDKRLVNGAMDSITVAVKIVFGIDWRSSNRCHDSTISNS